MIIASRVFSWMRKHWLAIFVTIFVTTLDGLSQFPPYERIFVWQTWFQTVARVIVSIWDLPLVTFVSLLQRRDLLIWLIPFWSMGLGLGIEWVSSKPNRPHARLFVASVLFAPSGLCGIAALLFGFSVEPTSACEKLISETNGIRVSAYHKTDSMGSDHLFLQSTNDAGKSWNQFYYSYIDWDEYDPLHFPKCENVKALNGQQFWIWNDYQFFMTRDGGINWQIGNLYAIWPAWIHDGYKIIADIQFTDSQNGRMTIQNIFPERPPIFFITIDSGYSWYESSKQP